MKPLTAYFQNTGLDSHREEDEGDNGRDLNEDESDKEHPDHIHEEDGVSEVERSQSDRLSEGEEEEEGIGAERTNENVESTKKSPNTMPNVGIVCFLKPRIHYIFTFHTYYISVTQVTYGLTLLSGGRREGVTSKQDPCQAADNCFGPTYNRSGCDIVSHCCVSSSFMGTKRGCFVAICRCFSSRFFKTKRSCFCQDVLLGQWHEK